MSQVAHRQRLREREPATSGLKSGFQPVSGAAVVARPRENVVTHTPAPELDEAAVEQQALEQQQVEDQAPAAQLSPEDQAANAAATEQREAGEAQSDLRAEATALAALPQDEYFAALEELQQTDTPKYDLIVAELNTMNAESGGEPAADAGEGDGFTLDPAATPEGAEGAAPAGDAPVDPTPES